jgi:hypothetical protein
VNIYELAQRAAPVCANTEKAPHNFEGFILTLGDMLMKAGKAEEAVGVYERAKLAPTYTAWPYREVLEKRVQDAPETARRVRNGEPAPMVPGSTYTCMACHAGAERQRQLLTQSCRTEIYRRPPSADT